MSTKRKRRRGHTHSQTRLAGYGWIRNPEAPTWSDMTAAGRQQLDVSLSKGPRNQTPHMVLLTVTAQVENLTCFRFLTVRYNSNDNFVVHSSDVHVKVPEAGVTEMSKTRLLTTRAVKSGWRGTHRGSCRRDAPGRVECQLHTASKRGQRCWEPAVWANGSPQMHTSHLRKGIPDWYCL